MNKSKLKSYAPQARKDFLTAVTARANLLGLSEKAGKLVVAVSEPQGDATIISGRAWPAKVHSQRAHLITRIKKTGFAQAMETVAYTWFNRFAALRYMELHGYLSHGHRALSSSEGTLPDILTHAADLTQNGELPGLNPAQVTEMKLAGNRDGELYRLLLVAQCNALNNAMPFLFERIDDETELLLPDNLLRTDSVIAKLVAAIDEEDWSQVEIIGWLYQFYISEKKNEVIGTVVKSEDIPAATQLFTPNWIVQYLVQNSVGRLWLMANPASNLKGQWPYYIEPSQQTPEVQAQLDILIQTRMNADDGSLTPESITLLDPACSSGHILVEAYEVLKAIYLERGYQSRAIARLILEKNLFGLDIDDRAAQMAGFSLIMKARADDRRLFDKPVKLNVMSLTESKGLDADKLIGSMPTLTVSRDGLHTEVCDAIHEFTDVDHCPSALPTRSFAKSIATTTVDNPLRTAITTLIAIFADAKTFGSLIRITQELKAQLAALSVSLHHELKYGDLYAQAAALDILPLVEQAHLLGMRFDAVIANPPYMSNKGMNTALKNFSKLEFPDSKADLCAMFIERAFDWCKESSFNGLVTMQSWMFLSSFEEMRTKLLSQREIYSFLHIGFNSFPELNSKIALACAFIFGAKNINDYAGTYVNLNAAAPSADKAIVFTKRDSTTVFTRKRTDFSKIPGGPVAYWVSQQALDSFSSKKILDISISEGQNITGDNATYVRFWWELMDSDIGRDSKWLPYAKGGDYRRWSGNMDYVVDWSEAARKIYRKNGSSRIIPEYLWYEIGVTWTLISITPSFRLIPANSTFDKTGSSIFFKEKKDIHFVLAYLNSCVAEMFLKLLNPTLALQVRDVRNLPLPITNAKGNVEVNAKELISISSLDENCNETARNFKLAWFLPEKRKTQGLPLTWDSWRDLTCQSFLRMKHLEEENNRIFIDAYAMHNELSAEVPEDRITVGRADREMDCQRLISYSVGCMMGRYSLDSPGLIYAKTGNVDFNMNHYAIFPADADGIVPLTEEFWFEDDAASRIREFLLAVWGADTIDENMAWLSESLGNKASETPDETIRRYLLDRFYKDHLQTYKKRPIYWLFSSGKQGAFQALVYLHRYHEGTLARLRAEYVLPLTGKIQSRIDMLQKDALAASSTAARNKLTKEIENQKKNHIELLAYDEQLRHYADMRITLDLDDGVKVNYGKFGDLLAEVKAVTGGVNDD